MQESHELWAILAHIHAALHAGQAAQAAAAAAAAPTPSLGAATLLEGSPDLLAELFSPLGGGLFDGCGGGMFVSPGKAAPLTDAKLSKPVNLFSEEIELAAASCGGSITLPFDAAAALQDAELFGPLIFSA